MVELAYYLIKSLFEDGRRVVTDKDRLREIQEKYPPQEIKRTLYLPSKMLVYQSESYEKVEKFEDWLKKCYKEEASQLKGRSLVYIGAGAMLFYLFFKPLFDAAYFPVRFMFESRYGAPIEQVPVKVVNTSVTLDAQWFTRILGCALGSLPFIATLIYGIKKWREAKKVEKFSKYVEELKKAQLSFESSQNLEAFENESKDMMKNLRENISILLETKDRKEMLQACRKIKGGMIALHLLSKAHGLEGVAKYYHSLEDKFLELERRLKKPRFWRSEERFIKELVRNETCKC